MIVVLGTTDGRFFSLEGPDGDKIEFVSHFAGTVDYVTVQMGERFAFLRLATFSITSGDMVTIAMPPTAQLHTASDIIYTVTWKPDGTWTLVD